MEAIKPAPKVLEVVIADLEFLHFVDDGLEVREGTYGSQGRGVGGAQQPAGGSKEQGVFDGLQWDSSVVQLSGQQTVLATDVSRGPRGLAVGVEDLADILFPAVMVRFHAVASALGIPQRRAVDMNGVAVVAKPAQQCIHHRLVAEEVAPFVVGEIARDNRGMTVVALFHELEEDVGLLWFEI